MRIEDISVGDRLVWQDPDQIGILPDQPYEVTVTSINGEIVCCEFDKTEGGCYGAVEAFASELSTLEEYKAKMEGRAS